MDGTMATAILQWRFGDESLWRGLSDNTKPDLGIPPTLGGPEAHWQRGDVSPILRTAIGEIHEVCADHPKKSTTDVTLQNNACNYPGGEVVNSVPELHHQHKEPHHVGMDDSMVQVEREPCADDVGNPGIGVRVSSESTLTPTLVIPGPGPVTCEADACGNHDATTPRPGLPTTPPASGTPVSRPRARDSWLPPSQQLLRALDLSQTVPACMTPQAPSESGMSMASDLSTLSACDLRTAVEAVNGFAMAAQTSPKARRD